MHNSGHIWGNNYDDLILEKKKLGATFVQRRLLNRYTLANVEIQNFLSCLWNQERLLRTPSVDTEGDAGGRSTASVTIYKSASWARTN